MVELLGVDGCWLGELDDGDVDCCELASGVVDCGELLLGDVCATAQTADNNRIAVIKDVFLMYVPPGLFGLPPAFERVEAALKNLDHVHKSRVCRSWSLAEKKRELRNLREPFRVSA